MKNDLSIFEKNLVRSINFKNGTNYKFNDLQDWNTSKKEIEKNIQEGEKIYESLGCYVAIKINKYENR